MAWDSWFTPTAGGATPKAGGGQQVKLRQRAADGDVGAAEHAVHWRSPVPCCFAAENEDHVLWGLKRTLYRLPINWARVGGLINGFSRSARLTRRDPGPSAGSGWSRRLNLGLGGASSLTVKFDLMGTTNGFLLHLGPALVMPGELWLCWFKHSWISHVVTPPLTGSPGIYDFAAAFSQQGKVSLLNCPEDGCGWVTLR